MENVQVVKKKGFLGNEKGLTLVELLAVIVILGIIAAIAVPSIGGLIEKTKKESHRSNAHLIIDAARMKVTTEGGGTQTIYVGKLVTDGYLEVMPNDPDNKGGKYTGDDTTGSFVTATKDANTGKFTYAITLKGKKDNTTDTDYYAAKPEADL